MLIEEVHQVCVYTVTHTYVLYVCCRDFVTDPLFHFREKFTYQEAGIVWYNPVQRSGRDAALEAEDDNNEGRKEEK